VTTTLLTSTFVPPEEAVLLLVRARSTEDVADVGRRADLAFDRIVEVVVLEQCLGA
jgi:hypothetical protein